MNIMLSLQLNGRVVELDVFIFPSSSAVAVNHYAL